MKNPRAVCEKSGWIHGAIRVSRCRIWGIFFLPNLHPLTLMVKKLGSSCQDMKPGPQGVRILAKPLWTGFHVLTQRSKFFRNASSHRLGFISVSGHETRSTRTCIPEKLGSPCQDMKPGPQGKLMYYYFYHGSDLCEIIWFLRKIECIEFECNEFVLVLVQIDLIHLNIQFVLVQLELKLIQIR